MSFADQIKKALAKKHAAQHPDAKSEAADGKSKPNKAPPVITGKPVKKVTGRGR